MELNNINILVLIINAGVSILNVLNNFKTSKRDINYRFKYDIRIKIINLFQEKIELLIKYNSSIYNYANYELNSLRPFEYNNENNKNNDLLFFNILQETSLETKHYFTKEQIDSVDMFLEILALHRATLISINSFQHILKKLKKDSLNRVKDKYLIDSNDLSIISYKIDVIINLLNMHIKFNLIILEKYDINDISIMDTFLITNEIFYKVISRLSIFNKRFKEILDETFFINEDQETKKEFRDKYFEDFFKYIVNMAEINDYNKTGNFQTSLNFNMLKSFIFTNGIKIKGILNNKLIKIYSTKINKLINSNIE